MDFSSLSNSKSVAVSLVVLAAWIGILIGGMFFSVRSLGATALSVQIFDRDVVVQGQQITDLGRRVATIEAVNIDPRLSVVETKQVQMAADIAEIQTLLKWIAGAVGTLLLQLLLQAWKFAFDRARLFKPTTDP